VDIMVEAKGKELAILPFINQQTKRPLYEAA
jgi:hypothetical protein